MVAIIPMSGFLCNLLTQPEIMPFPVLFLYLAHSFLLTINKARK